MHYSYFPFFSFCIESLIFFLPAIVANTCPDKPPALFRLIGRPEWNVPMSVRWFGAHKTYPAYPAGIIGAVATVFLIRWVSDGDFYGYSNGELVLIGFLFGFGAVLGDHFKSFVKRQIGKKPGEEWRFWDRTDYVFGALLMASLYFGQSIWVCVIVLIPVAYFLHPVVNTAGYMLGLRSTVH